MSRAKSRPSRKESDRYAFAKNAADGAPKKGVKPPFGYYGAKARLSAKIVSMLPPHNAWVEGFCGSAAITLAKPAAPIEIINDADGEIVNLFKQLRSNPEELIRSIELTPYARDEFQESKERERGLTKLERARRFLVATMMTVNATGASPYAGFSYSQSYSRQGREARVNRWCNLPDRLWGVVERLRGVRVEHKDAVELVRMFEDRPATLVYLDPPYFARRGHKYFIDNSTLQFHEELLDVCCKTRCMVLISGYDNDLYKKRLTSKAGWKSEKVRVQTRDTTGRSFSRTEMLWMNKRFVSAQKSGQVPVTLTKKERSEYKLNPPRRR